MLKADFHIHTKEDPHDLWIKYSAKDMINHAAKLGFNVLSITNHHKIYYNKELADYAKKKGILLIPGVETHINGKEVLLLNVKKPGKLNDFSDLTKLKNENIIVIAPHPFYNTSSCLGKDLLQNIKYFDGIEYSHFYLNKFNVFNKKALEVAKNYNKTILGTSDMHRLFQMGYTFSLVNSEKNIDSILESIRKNKIEIQTKSLSYINFARIFSAVILSGFKRKINKTKFDNSYY
jgi:predicted metal-dependent phosphoesterase TrpH